jgi:hypothetical protein
MNIDYSKISSNQDVIALLKQRDDIEDKIREIDDNAIIRYELAMLSDCNKVANRIECEECGYPLSEALYPDNYDEPLYCNSSQKQIAAHIVCCNVTYRW